MEFRITKTESLRRLGLAQGIADRKSTMPMLANVLVRTREADVSVGHRGREWRHRQSPR